MCDPAAAWAQACLGLAAACRGHQDAWGSVQQRNKGPLCGYLGGAAVPGDVHKPLSVPKLGRMSLRPRGAAASVQPGVRMPLGGGGQGLRWLGDSGSLHHSWAQENWPNQTFLERCTQSLPDVFLGTWGGLPLLSPLPPVWLRAGTSSPFMKGIHCTGSSDTPLTLPPSWGKPMVSASHPLCPRAPLPAPSPHGSVFFGGWRFHPLPPRLSFPWWVAVGGMGGVGVEGWEGVGG